MDVQVSLNPTMNNHCHDDHRDYDGEDDDDEN